MAEVTRNRLANASNRFQTNAKRVLALCSAGLLRSPTTANVLHAKYGYNTRAAGVAEDYAMIPVDQVMLCWADEIVCVEYSVENKLRQYIADNFDDNDAASIIPKIVVLAIPDMYSWNEAPLRAAIEQQYGEYLATKSLSEATK